MATLSALSDRVRMELGDIGKSFVHQLTADGITNRYVLPFQPIDAPTLVVKVNGIDVSNDVELEEHTGTLTFDVVPDADASIIAAGTSYRYFTNSEIEQFVTTALSEHTHRAQDQYGRKITLKNLPSVEEYPVALLASSLALMALATDAAFDIDIIAPDGVNIPRSERYRQLMEIVNMRQGQYQELCEKLGIGLYRIEVFHLRRVSQRTNRLNPIYQPQEVDDRSRPQRVYLPIPSYGAAPTESTVATHDLALYEGDSYSMVLDFPFDISGYTVKAQIRDFKGSGTVLANFLVTPDQNDNTKVTLSLTSQQTDRLPERGVWDVQLTAADDPTFEQTHVKGIVITERQVTV